MAYTQSPSRIPVSLLPPNFTGKDDLLAAANQRLLSARVHNLTTEKAHLYALGACKTIMANELVGACHENQAHALHRQYHQKSVNG